jgi:hypothetical protein
MLVERKPFVYVWRPMYRGVFGGVVWPFLGRVKEFFQAETNKELSELRTQMKTLMQLNLENMRTREDENRLLARIDRLDEDNRRLLDRIGHLQDEQSRQWHGIETLLLCLIAAPSPAEQENPHDEITSEPVTGTRFPH